MCTVSYVPHITDSNDFLVTFNRDESINRPAEWPKIHQEYDTLLYYPKDKRAGGTWIGVSRKKRLMCLMNGAFSPHKSAFDYRKSRGVVVKEVLAADNLTDVIEKYDFEGIEPFFGLLFIWESTVKVLELVWDGKELFLNYKDKNQPNIWSSAMMYPREEQEKRELKFGVFLKNPAQKTPQRIWAFHHDKGSEEEEGLLINRGELQTTSISQFYHVGEGNDYFHFQDLVTGKENKEEIIWEA